MMSNRRILVKNTFWLGLVEAISKLILFGVTISIVRYLGPSLFGSFNLAFAYVSMFMIVGDFGMATVATREIAKHKDLSEKYLGNLVGIKLFLSLVIVVLIGISMLIVPTASTTKSTIVLVMFYYFMQNISSIFLGIFSAWEKMELVFLSRISFYLGLLIFTLLVIYFKGTMLQIVLGYGLAAMISTFFSIYLLNKIEIKLILSFDKTFWIELFKETIPFMGLAIVTTIYANNDTLLIGKYFGTTQTGFYQSAYKILFAFQSINFINSAIFPRISVLIHENKLETLRKLIKFVVIFSAIGLIPLGLGITYWQKDIIRIIYGNDFLSTAPAMVLLVWAGIINYFRIFTSNLLFAKSRQHDVFVAVALGLIINIFINYWILPQSNFVVAAWSMLISEVVILTVTLIKLNKAL